MSDLTTKIKVNYSVDRITIKEFNTIAKQKAVNKSGLIELLIKKWIKDNKNDNN